jgi:dihydropyrimidinase
MDLVIENGKVVIPGVGVVQANIGIENGKIVEIARITGNADQKVDAGGKYVIPGVIDPHIHLGIFAPFEKECEFETKSALAGGVTTVGCFYGGPDSYKEVFDQVVKTAESYIYTDIFFHLVIGTDQQIEEMEQYARDLGVTSFKFYMCGIPGIIEPVNDGFLLKAFRKIADMGYPAIGCVHAENAALVDLALEELRKAKENGTLEDWAESHPNYAEEEAVTRISFIAGLAGARLYVVHLSTKEGVMAAEMAKSKYDNIFVETTSPYLSITKFDDIGLMGLMVPPFRENESVEALWDCVRRGIIDSFGTDNVSMTREVKNAEQGMWNTMPGYPFLGTHLPVLLHEGFHRRNIELTALVEKATRDPARIFGLYPNKGTIAVGSDADLVIVDLDKERKVNHEELHSYSDFSLLDGRILKGWPVMTIKSGEIAVEDNQVLVKKGNGKYLRRNLRE